MKKSAAHRKKVAFKKASPRASRFIITFISVTVLYVLMLVLLKSSFLRGNCANSISCIKNLTTQVENDAVGTFAGQKVIPPKIDLAQEKTRPTVLGAETPAGPKHIYVDLTTQTLTAYQGDKLVMKTLVSTGKWGKTPTGEFTIWVTLRSTRMSGGSGADYYNLPNVPFVMFFSNNEVAKERGYSLHGAYWHNNFGYTMSHGCVNMRIVDSEALYNWVDPQPTANTTHATKDNPGTPITIFGASLI